MVSTYTPNINLEEPARGDQVGTWDTPVNNNMTLVDLVVGGIATISLNNSPVVLSAAQFQARQITFNSTLTGSVAITFPSTFTKSYDIQNLCTGSSAFVITLGTTVAGGQVVAVPFGETTEVFSDGSNIKFRNLGRVGTYWDYAGSSVPAWVSACTVPPFLYANGGTFSATTYPVLAVIMGSTTLPDTRGRARFGYNDGTSRLTNAVSLNGDIRFLGGGDQNIVTHFHANTLTEGVGHSHGLNQILETTVFNGGGAGVAVLNRVTGGSAGLVTNLAQATVAGGVTITNANAGTGTAGNVPPCYIGGITMIRAA